MDSARTAAVKTAIFLIVAVAFVGILLFYTQGMREGWGSKFESQDTSRDADANSLNGRRHIEKIFSVQPGGELMVDTDFGDVEVEGWEHAEVEISVDLEGDPDELKKFDLQFRQSDNRVEVLGILKKRGWRFRDWIEMHAKYSIRVPLQFMVHVSTAGGDIRLRAVNGVVKLGTSGGDVRVGEVQGKTKVETSGGDVIVKEVIGNVSVETSGGDIEVSSVQGDTQAETSGGDVRIVSFDGKIEAQTSGGDIEVRAGGENRGMSLETSGGDIVIYLPLAIAATLDASTTGGEVESELEIATSGKIQDDELRGNINGGGELIKARTSGGDISIRILE